MKKGFTRFALLSDRIYFMYATVLAGFLLFEKAAYIITNECCGDYLTGHGFELILKWIIYSVTSFGPLLLLFYFFFQLVQWIRYSRWGRLGVGLLCFLIIIALWFFTLGPVVAFFDLYKLITGHTLQLL